MTMVVPLLSTIYADDCDVQQLDKRLEMFFATISCTEMNWQ